jgi:photosystem II stability/assembly factor-like uncharacterized protein
MQMRVFRICADLVFKTRCFIFAAFFFGSIIIASAQNGIGWTATQRGLPGKDLNAVFFIDSKRGWIAGDGGQVLRTEDGGKSWIQQQIATTDGISDVYFRNRNDGYLLSGNRIFTTEDGGETWREAHRFTPAEIAFDGANRLSANTAAELYSVRFTSKKKGWIVGAVTRRDVVVDSLVLYTSDAGDTWIRQRVPSKTELIHLAFINDKRGWIVGANGVILHTADGGQSWTAQNANTRATLYHVDFRNERVGWIVGAQATILRTFDGGLTWIADSSVPPDARRATLLSVQFANEMEGWIVGRGGLILHSIDGGATWTQQASGTKQNLFALFVEKKNIWAVGGDGLILQYAK